MRSRYATRSSAHGNILEIILGLIQFLYSSQRLPIPSGGPPWLPEKAKFCRLLPNTFGCIFILPVFLLMFTSIERQFWVQTLTSPRPGLADKTSSSLQEIYQIYCLFFNQRLNHQFCGFDSQGLTKAKLLLRCFIAYSRILMPVEHLQDATSQAQVWQQLRV